MQSGSNLPQFRDIYIISGVMICVILIVIISLSLCIVYILCYHFKNKQSQLGRRLRRDPSPIQLEAQHFQGSDTPPILYTDTNTQVVNRNHLLGPSDQQQLYNYSQNSGVSGISNYSGLSDVSQKKGPHHMPHFKEPSVVYHEGSNLVPIHLSVPPGPLGSNVNNPMVLTDGPSNRSQRASVLSQHSQHQSPHMQPISYNSGSGDHFILANVKFAMMQNKNCQIPGCSCYKVREKMENRGYRHPYTSSEISSVYGSGSGNSSTREEMISHQRRSTYV